MWKWKWAFQRQPGQITLETVCYVESVFIVTLLEGMMTAAVNDVAYSGPWMVTSSRQNVAAAFPLCEPQSGLGLTVAGSWAKTPTVIELWRPHSSMWLSYYFQVLKVNLCFPTITLPLFPPWDVLLYLDTLRKENCYFWVSVLKSWIPVFLYLIPKFFKIPKTSF